MALITVQDLQDIAVNATSDFFNNSTPLNQSLAKQASARGLNSEQLKRAVEATNTLTHLKSIEVGTDRTAEFPVANYNEIVKMASLPDSIVNQADFSGSDTEDFGVEKTASVADAESALAYTAPEMSQEEKVAHLQKMAAINVRLLEDAKVELEIVGTEMLSKIASLRTNPEFVEHLSASSATDEEFTKIAALVTKSSPTRKDFVTGMFKSAQLNEVNYLVDMYKQASSLAAEIKHRQASQDRWEAISAELTKQAFLKPLMAAASNFGKKILAAPGVPDEVRKSVSFKLTSLATRAATKPFRVVGNAGLSAVAAGAKAGGKAINNAVAGTKIGKTLGVEPKAISPAVKRTIAYGIPLGMAAADASMFEPKVDPAKDRSGRVWDALQS